MACARRALGTATLVALLLTAGVSFAQANDPARWSRIAAETYLERAERARSRGDTLAAVTAFTEALRIDPTLGRAYFGLAELRRLLGDVIEAERLLSRATALPDVRADALTQRARLYRLQRRDDLALSDLEAATESDPSAERLHRLADFYIERRAWVAALAVWRRVAAHPELTPSERERAEVSDTVAALAVLASEADAVQLVEGSRNTVRRTLQRHARPQRAAKPR